MNETQKQVSEAIRLPVTDLVIEEANQTGSVFFTGTALVDNALSKNRRLYTPEFNDSVIARFATLEQRGQVATVYSRHAKAVGNILNGGLAEGLPVGRVLSLQREGNRVKFRGVVFPTTEGKDVSVLLQNKVISAVSVRIPRDSLKSRPARIDGAHVEVMEEGEIAGLDFTDDPGVTEARIEHVFESAPQVTELEDSMIDWTKVTKEELRTNVAPLLNEVIEEVSAPLKAQVADLTQKLAVAVESANEVKGQVSIEAAELNEKLSNATAALEETKLSLYIAQKSQMGVSKVLCEALTAKKLKTAQEVDAVLEDAKATALQEAFATMNGPHTEKTSATGTTKTERDPDGSAPALEEDTGSALLDDLPTEYQEMITIVRNAGAYR